MSKGRESECPSEAHRQKSQENKKLEAQAGTCSRPDWEKGEWMGNRGEGKSEVFLLIPKAQQAKGVTPNTDQQSFMVKVF